MTSKLLDVTSCVNAKQKHSKIKTIRSLNGIVISPQAIKTQNHFNINKIFLF